MADAGFTTYQQRGDIVCSPIDGKSAVLSFMESREPVAVAMGGFVDPVSGEYINELLAYEDGPWTWDSRDVRFLRLYDAQLNPDFIAYALAHCA